MKKLKQVASATVLATMVMTGIVPTLAADTQKETNPYIEPVAEPSLPEGMLTKEQAIAKVKTMFATEIGSLKMINARYDEHDMTGAPTWEIQFSSYDVKESSKPSNPLDELYISIHAKTGNLLQFQHRNPAWQGSHFPYDDVAEAAADRFLDLYAPEYHKDFKSSGIDGETMSSSGGPNQKEEHWSSSTLHYTEQVHGIPFTGNRLQFDVDEYGNVIAFYADNRLDASTLPTPDHALSIDSANAMYRQQFPMTKMYMSDWYASQMGHREADPRLLFVPESYYNQIDAFTGQAVQPLFYLQPMLHEAVSLTSSGEWIPTGKADVQKQVEHMLNLDLSDYEQRVTNNAEAGIYDFQWRKIAANGEETGASARYDAKTGQLQSLQKIGPLHKHEQTLTIAEAQQKAQELLQNVLPKGQHDMMLIRTTNESKFNKAPSWYKPDPDHAVQNSLPANYSFDFAPVHQGVPIYDQQVSVEIDGETGNMLSYNALPIAKLDLKLPDNVGTVTPEAAQTAFLQDHPLHLEYRWDRYFDQYAPQGELVYVPDYKSKPTTYVDAFTGQSVVLSHNDND